MLAEGVDIELSSLEVLDLLSKTVVSSSVDSRSILGTTGVFSR